MNTQQKIEVLEKTLELLGPEGEHWGQGFYYGEKQDDGSTRARSTSEQEEVLDNANTFCLVGAVGESAYQLGYSINRLSETADKAADVISITTLARAKSDLYQDATYFNDDQDTSFADVRELIETRIAQLKGEL